MLDLGGNLYPYQHLPRQVVLPWPHQPQSHPLARGRRCHPGLVSQLPPLPKLISNAATKCENSGNATAPKSNASAPSLSLASSTTPPPLHPPPGFTSNPWIPWKKAPTNLTLTPPPPLTPTPHQQPQFTGRRQRSVRGIHMPAACRVAWFALGRRLPPYPHRHRRIADSTSLQGKLVRLYRVIRVFLMVVIVFLGFKLVAYFKGWHFRRPDPSDVLRMLVVVYAVWVNVHA
ncbi:hypothetical protein V8G54_034180 [Vigna mungo]|uniref:Uncharacterized protein n=1 Tax=Vigna mungo TaxID=3915 RepID=A0AAQ3MQ02_VIGMU